MIRGDHDPDLGSWLTLGLAGLAVAAGNASAQVVVPDICQFGALDDPEDRPPSVVDSMLSGTHPAWLISGPQKSIQARPDPRASRDHSAYAGQKGHVGETLDNPIAMHG